MSLQEGCKEKSSYLEIEDLFFSYQRGENVLNDISVSFNRAEFTAIMGPNGSGKTTLGKLMAGILTPDRGNVFVDGENTREISIGSIGRRVGYLFQEPERQLFTPTVREEIGFVNDFMGRVSKEIDEKITEIIDIFSLGGLESSSPYRISRGEKQRVALASVLINEPSFLVLDEPTTGLDIVRKEELAGVLRNLKCQGIGLAVISHDLDFVQDNADRIIQLRGGEINEA